MSQGVFFFFLGGGGGEIVCENRGENTKDLFFSDQAPII